MKHTLKQRQLIALAFKRALLRLPAATYGTGVSPYICDNLYATSNDDIAKLAADVIDDRINHSRSVEDWLSSRSSEIADQVRQDLAFNRGLKLQAYRRAWLRKLVEEFSK